MQQLSTLIDELDALQAHCNNGRGISCVRSIIIYARAGQFRSAIATCINENDKIRNYKDVQALLRQAFPAYDQHLANFESKWTTIRELNSLSNQTITEIFSSTKTRREIANLLMDRYGLGYDLTETISRRIMASPTWPTILTTLEDTGKSKDFIRRFLEQVAREKWTANVALTKIENPNMERKNGRPRKAR